MISSIDDDYSWSFLVPVAEIRSIYLTDANSNISKTPFGIKKSSNRNKKYLFEYENHLYIANTLRPESRQKEIAINIFVHQKMANFLLSTNKFKTLRLNFTAEIDPL